ncbi:PD-(D/E)XK nuclease family protein, partial [Candidatus Magnetobacterium casense]
MSTTPETVESLFQTAVTPACSPSALLTLLKCPRMFLLQNRLRLSRRGYFSESLIIGRLYHAARAAAVIDPNTHGDTEIAREAALITDEVSSSADLDTGRLPNGQTLDQVLVTIRKSEELACAMSRVAKKVFPWPETPADVWETTSEVPYHYTNDLGVEFSGRFDAVTKHYSPELKRDEIWVMEHKTTSLDIPTFFETARFDLQFRVYAAALRQLYGNSPYPAGVILEALNKPSIRQKKTETRDAYIQRVMDWYCGTGEYETERASREISPVYHREALRFPVADPELDFLFTEFEVYAKKNPSIVCLFPKYPHSCVKFIKSVCPFLPLCNVDPGSWPGLLKCGLFVQKGHDNVNHDTPDSE